MPERGAPRRNPRDYTGREDDDLKRTHADEIEQAGAEMAMAGSQPKVRKRSKEVTDLTDAARPKATLKPKIEEPSVPKEYVVRLVASIEDMTFGREILFAGEFDERGDCTREPILGGLKTYNFTEGKLYKVDEPLYIHLKDLGYLYDEDE